MLYELKRVRQIAGEGTRRWFRDFYFDLIVWYDDPGDVIGFQLCYDKPGRERSLTWRKNRGFQHELIDAGETAGHSRMTPVSLPDPGAFPRDEVALLFLRASGVMDQEISRLVYETISRYPWRAEEAGRAV